MGDKTEKSLYISDRYQLKKMKRFAWVFTTIQLLGMGQVNSVIANEFENTSNSESPSMTVEIEDDTFENTSNRLEAI